MSSTQVVTGWQPPATFKLRTGQQQIVQLLNDPQSRPRQRRQLIAVHPTGYGKTLSICCAYAALRQTGAVQRLLIVVPSAEQFSSYLDEIESDMARVGGVINLVGVVVISLFFYFIGTAIMAIDPTVLPQWAERTALTGP